MAFHCANRRRKRRLQPVAVEPYLGDIIGAMPSPMRPVYLRRIEAHCWVQRGTHLILAGTAATVIAGLLIVSLAMLFVFHPATPFAG